MHSSCVRLLPTEIQIIKDETIALLDIIETIYYRTSYKNQLYDTLQAAMSFNIWQLSP